MRKTLYFALLFCLTVTAAQSQISSMAQIAMPYQINKTIVREHVYPATISYVETSVMHCFVYDDSFGNITTVSIDSDFSVNDFVVEEDQLYFCGCYKGISGFIGQIDISDFFWGSLHYDIFPDSYISSTEDVATLTKLVFYTNSNEIHILAIGETSLGASCVEDLFCNISSFTWYYQVGVLPLALGEKLLGVAVGTDIVVTAGLYRTSDRQVYIRATSTNSLFFASTLDQFELLDNGGPLYLHVRDNLAIASIGKNISDDAFAVATIWDYHDLENPGVYLALSERGVFVTTFGVTPPTLLTSLQVSPYNSTVTYQPQDTLGWNLQGLTRASGYMNPFFLLQRAKPFSGSPVQSIVSEFSVNAILNSTGVPFWTTSDAVFQSIDSYNSTSQYIMNGIHNSNPAKMSVGIGSHNNNVCMDFETFQNEAVNMTTITNTNVPFTVYAPIATSPSTYFGTEEDALQKEVKCKE